MMETRQCIHLGQKTRSKSPRAYLNTDRQNNSIYLSNSERHYDTQNNVYNISKVITRKKDSQNKNRQSRSIIDQHSLCSQKILSKTTDIFHNSKQPIHTLQGSPRSIFQTKQAPPLEKSFAPSHRRILSNLTPNKMPQALSYELPNLLLQKDLERKVKILQSRITELHKQKQISILKLHEQNRKLISQNCHLKNSLQIKLNHIQKQQQNIIARDLKQTKFQEEFSINYESNYKIIKNENNQLMIKHSQLQKQLLQSKQKIQTFHHENQSLKASINNIQKDKRQIESKSKQIIKDYESRIAILSQQIFNNNKKQQSLQQQVDLQADQIINKIILLEEENLTIKQQSQEMNKKYNSIQLEMNNYQEINNQLKQTVESLKMRQTEVLQYQQQYQNQLEILRTKLNNKSSIQETTQTQFQMKNYQTCRKCNELMRTVTKLNAYINRK